ncbi:acyl-CoA dehydrogenase family protein [Pseudobacillus badius]|uniref:acyl-CoA dehydrogenase family protein n=1 Tax=Bacillus badius TaxID=1455 RepID=UPI0024A3F420|nr:acyl-CoA dehydrogenase family protein [Bacillus badius]GLY11172.1 dehydrogenase [Bacillus badius]
MDFSLNEDQETFRKYVRKHLEDNEGMKTARQFIRGDREKLKVVEGGLSELGCYSIPISEAYGGLGLGPLDLVPVLEEFGRVLLPGLYIETLALAVPLIDKYGSEELKNGFLPGIAAGEKTVSIAWLEPGKQYSPADIQLSACKEEDFVLNGIKTIVPDGDQADAYIIPVRTAFGKGQEGISVLLVDRTAAIDIRGQKCMDETRYTAELTFQNVRVPKDRLIGPLHGGWEVFQEALLHLNAALCSFMVGGMEKIVDMAVDYASIRMQFGQPIGRFQAIKHKIADMKLDLETARSLSYYANWVLEGETEDCKAAIYSARSFITEAYIRTAAANVQIHGGIGFTEELDCHLYVKKSRFCEQYLGSIEEHREIVACALGWQLDDLPAKPVET